VTSALRLALPAVLAIALASCGDGSRPDAAATGSADAPVATPAANETLAADEQTVIGEDGLPEGTPMKERVATLGLLNKRNNLSQDITLKPGEEKRVGDVLIKLASCERRPPWDPEPEEGAFVQVFRQDPDSDDDDPKWNRIFSGWLFRNSPSLNVVEDPIYDVWIKSCAMRFPGEEESSASKAAKPSGNEANGA